MKGKLTQFMQRAMLDPDQFKKVQPLVSAENDSALKLSCIVQLLYFGVSLISALGITEMSDKQLVYGIGTVIPLATLLLHRFVQPKHPEIQPWLIRGFCIGLFLTGLLCTLICTPDEMTILLLIFFFCVPMIFIVPPYELFVFVLFADMVYFSSAWVKTPDVRVMDMIDVGIFSTLSFILGAIQMRGRYRRYWLETNAIDLAEVRYQAAFTDQLTGALNRNAYNRDAEELVKTHIAPDFMYIAADLNGLKKANDSMGHVAGDELIRGAVDVMTKCFEGYGKVYRVGGDEFVVLLNMNGTSAGELLDRLNTAADAWQGALVSKLSISYGVVTGYEAKEMTFHEVELLADKRMYQSKSDYYKNTGLERREN